MINGKNYQLLRPLQTHWREATCKEVDCPHWLMGWETYIDEGEGLGQMQAAYIRHESGRHFTERRDEAGLTVFTFPQGQRCFRSNHRLPLDRMAIPRIGQEGQVRTVEGDVWLNDFNETTYRIGKRRQEG